MKQSTKRDLFALLKENSFERTEESSTGKINPNKIALAKVTDKVFKRSIPNTWKDYKVELLVDASGSMYWDWMKEAVEVTQEIVRYFYWIISVNITFFNYLETKKRGREILSIDTSKLTGWAWNEELFSDNTTEVTIGGRTLFQKSSSGFKSAYWNWEVCNLVNAWERIRKEEGEKVVIIIGDWAINTDRHSESTLIDGNYYIAGQPVAQYNSDTYKSTVERIEKDGVSILPLCIWGNYYKDYYSNAVTLRKVEEAGHLILDFFKKHFGKQ